MVDVVQLVRASDCGSECRGFESHLPPIKVLTTPKVARIFCCHRSLLDDLAAEAQQFLTTPFSVLQPGCGMMFLILPRQIFVQVREIYFYYQ